MDTRDERIKELLEQPGFEATKGIKGPSLADHIQEPQVEPKAEAETDESEQEETESGGKKVRIPASRLKTLTSKIDTLEQEKSTFAQRLAELEARIEQNKENEDDLPEWWKEAYGDSEVSKQGYKSQQRIMREEMARNLREMEAQREAEEAEREERVNAIEKGFDDQMDELETELGRELTANQKSELMDIVAEYSPQEGGQYIAYLPLDKAYDIWTKSQGVSQSKQEMARIAGAQSQGGASSQSSTERPQWGDWRKRYGL